MASRDNIAAMLTGRQWAGPLPGGTRTSRLLLPELTQLRHLEELDVSIWLPLQGVPAEWTRVGAFPRLKMCAEVGRCPQQ